MKHYHAIPLHGNFGGCFSKDKNFKQKYDRDVEWPFKSHGFYKTFVKISPLLQGGVSKTQTSKTQTSDHRPRKCRPRKHRPRKHRPPKRRPPKRRPPKRRPPKHRPRKRRPGKHGPCKQRPRKHRRVTNTLKNISLCS